MPVEEREKKREREEREMIRLENIPMHVGKLLMHFKI